MAISHDIIKNAEGFLVFKNVIKKLIKTLKLTVNSEDDLSRRKRLDFKTF